MKLILNLAGFLKNGFFFGVWQCLMKYSGEMIYAYEQFSICTVFMDLKAQETLTLWHRN